MISTDFFHGMKRKWITLGLLSVLICVPLYQLVKALAGMNRIILIAGGPEKGLYHPIAISLSNVVARLGYRATVLTTDGSLENLKLVAEGGADLALFQPGSRKNLKEFAPALLEQEAQRIDPARLGHVAFVANLYSQPLHIAVREGSGIESLRDLEGKVVNLGPELSADYPMSGLLLRSLELEPGENHRNLAYTELIGAFDRGEVDAAFITVGMQADVFQALARSGKVRFLSVPNNEALAAMELHLSPFKVPRGIYQFEGEAVPRTDIQTVATGAHLITRGDVESGFVEKITQEILKTPFQKENRLGELFEQGKSFASARPFFPMHEGAKWVYEPESRTLLKPEIVDMWESMRSFFVSILVAGFVGYQWYRKKKDRTKEGRLDYYIREVIKIEQQQMMLDTEQKGNDMEKLQRLQDDLTNLRQECFKDFSGHQLQEEPGTDCFLKLCASLSEKLNAKMTRLRLGGEIARLAKAIEENK
ncbi:MAG: TAXI family TRAP transporter solute-binding subunit [Verrucomicrobiota bacterium]|nr:TAXI family TRAP transporter solute-binding subunit [Verrucomicrobiota bacterium]MDP7177059.1 TAXI family TRAP transporter solute-binding subunit [Verrucomicrobiota bacterium]MDP7293581.1 TAXI family TRAP transporter solute-binding subunit [Verrucomicrobiota bacterium]MDP7440739.1 TAXI family TRAP transporter solute-binding subunit [Verrucomicrobiota bacterium]MDP7584973.1 TAXI family TRAP transporter solute-binding subunit [Verrucomicrobiota bacterium]